MFESIALKLLVSLLLGAAIGLERESSQPQNHATLVGGVRTFALVALLGSIGGLFYASGLPWVFAVASVAFVALLSIHYFMASQVTKDFGLTTEVSFILTFLLGVMATTNIAPLHLVVSISIILILVLALKTKTRNLVSEVTRHEIEAFVSYAIIALVILPFLPNVGYTVNDVPLLKSLLEGLNMDTTKFNAMELLNPRKLWFIVVLVTGIDVLGYVLSKFMSSKRGFLISSLVGGFVSSTSITLSLAHKSKKLGNINSLVGAATIANAASFIQVLLLVGPLNGQWLVAILPTIILMALSGSLVAYLFWRKNINDPIQDTEAENKKIFSLVPAMKFAVLLITVKIVTSVCLVLFGQSGFVISSIIASFAGLDAIVVNLATLAGGVITFKFALIVFILVNATNLLGKTVYSFLQGTKEFAFKFLGTSLAIIAVSFAGLLFL